MTAPILSHVFHQQVEDMAKEFASRTHFVHLRNVTKATGTSGSIPTLQRHVHSAILLSIKRFSLHLIFRKCFTESTNFCIPPGFLNLEQSGLHKDSNAPTEVSPGIGLQQNPRQATIKALGPKLLD